MFCVFWQDSFSHQLFYNNSSHFLIENTKYIQFKNEFPEKEKLCQFIYVVLIWQIKSKIKQIQWFVKWMDIYTETKGQNVIICVLTN